MRPDYWPEKLTERYEIRVSGVIDPTAANNDLFAKIAEVCDGAAKRCKSQLEKGEKYLERRSLTHT